MPENCSTKKVKISLMGKNGKMGRAISELAARDPSVEIADVGDVVIDFSSPEGTKKAIAMQKPLVCGTTGLSEEIFEQLKILSQKVPVLYSPNFSLGMTLCFEILTFLKKRMPKNVEITIEETHHTEKVDAPSGSAKKMAALLGVKQVVSHREKGVVGTHNIDFSLGEEKISLRHVVFSREVFAKGAIEAAKILFHKAPHYYSLHDILVAKQEGGIYNE